MTISSRNRQAGPFVGNDTATDFPFAFKVFTAADLLVIRTDPSGVDSPLAATSDFTAVLNVDQNANPGGTVMLPAALASNYKLTITSDIAALQTTDLTNQGGFYPSVITNAFDKLTILIQQLLGTVGRSIQIPMSDGGGGITLPGRDTRKGTILAFDATTGDPVAGPGIASVGTVAGAIEAIKTVANDLIEPVSEIEVVANNIDAINAASGHAATARDAAAYLASYMDAVVMNIQFPLDLGLISDSTIYNHFDLGSV